jgi:hypothetical protein
MNERSAELAEDGDQQRAAFGASDVESSAAATTVLVIYPV